MKTRARIATAIGLVLVLALVLSALAGNERAAWVLAYAIGAAVGTTGLGYLVARHLGRWALVVLAVLVFAGSLALPFVVDPYALLDHHTLAGGLERGFLLGFIFSAVEAFRNPEWFGRRRGERRGDDRTRSSRPDQRWAFRRDLDREPTLARRVLAVLFVAFAVLLIYAALNILVFGSGTGGGARLAPYASFLMGMAFLLSSVAELLPGGLRRPRAYLRTAGSALILALTLAFMVLVAAFVAGIGWPI